MNERGARSPIVHEPALAGPLLRFLGPIQAITKIGRYLRVLRVPKPGVIGSSPVGDAKSNRYYDELRIDFSQLSVFTR